jgi:FG-GAP-like repeat
VAKHHRRPETLRSATLVAESLEARAYLSTLSFSNAVPTEADESSYGVTGDFNNDGHPDFATLSGSQLQISLNQGDGSFKVSQTIALTGENPTDILAADLGNGQVDLVVSDGNNQAIDVLIGNGDGTFQAPIAYKYGDIADVPGGAIAGGPLMLLPGGAPDIVVGKALNAPGEQNSELVVMDNNGQGVFSQGHTIQLPSTDPDFNNFTQTNVMLPGSPTVLVGFTDNVFDANQQPFLTILTGTAGSFEVVNNDLELGIKEGGAGDGFDYQISQIAVGDFNGDGISDMAVLLTSTGKAQLSVLLGTGDGDFQAPIVTPITSATTFSMVAADFRNVGYDDLLIGNELLQSNGDGTFTDEGKSPQVINAFQRGIADYNGDGFLDLLDQGTSGSTFGTSIEFNTTGLTSTTTTLTTNDDPGDTSIATIPVTLTATVPGGVPGTDVAFYAETGSNRKTELLGDSPLRADHTATLIQTLNINGDNELSASYLGTATTAASVSSLKMFSISGGSVGTPGGIGLTPTIVRSNVPSAVVGGAKLHSSLTVDLANSSASQEKGFTINVYASTNINLDTSSDTKVTSVTKSIVIKGGKTVALTIPILNLPAGLPDGTYYLIVEPVDSSGNTASAATSSTVVIAAPFVSLSETLTSTLPPALVSGLKAKGTVTLTITNSGNVPSKGSTGIEITASTTSGLLGTTIANLSKTLTILPGKSAKVAVPIKSIPALTDGNYFLVAQVTDPLAGGTSIASSTGTTDIAAPFISLAPAFTTDIKIAGNGTAIVSLTITNNGNITPVGKSEITLFASATPDISESPQLIGQTVALPIQPGKSKIVKTHLTAAMVQTAQAEGALVAEVMDPLGGSQTTFTALPA